MQDHRQDCAEESLREQSERVDIHDKLARVPIKDVEKPSGASGVVTPENQKDACS